jgi:hypothetical protein
LALLLSFPPSISAAWSIAFLTASSPAVARASRTSPWRTGRVVAQYLSEHAGLYNELVPLVLQGDAEGFGKFKDHFGATAIARAITKKAGGGPEESCGKSQVQVTAPYRASVSPLLKKPPQRPSGWESREEKNNLKDYLQNMLPE